MNSVLTPLRRILNNRNNNQGNKALGELLVDHNLLTPPDLERAEAQAKQKSVGLNDALLDGGFLSESDLRVFLAVESQLPVKDVTQVASQPQSLDALSMGGLWPTRSCPSLSMEIFSLLRLNTHCAGV